MTAVLKRIVIEVARQGEFITDRYEFTGSGAKTKADQKFSELSRAGKMPRFKREEFRKGRWIAITHPNEFVDISVLNSERKQ